MGVSRQGNRAIIKNSKESGIIGSMHSHFHLVDDRRFVWWHRNLLPDPYMTRRTSCSQTKLSMSRPSPKHGIYSKYPVNVCLPSRVSKPAETAQTLPLSESILYCPPLLQPESFINRLYLQLLPGSPTTFFFFIQNLAILVERAPQTRAPLYLVSNVISGPFIGLHYENNVCVQGGI